MPPTPRETVENTIPVLAVNDVQASIRFYRDALGFQRDWGGEDEASHLASVSRDGHAIMLQRRGPVTPGCVWIGVSGLAGIWEAVRAGRATVVQRPTNQPWALEMRIADPDGNTLWFGAEPLKGVPFGQEAPEDRLHAAEAEGDRSA